MNDEAFLRKIKKFLGIAEEITVYDEELTHWIQECIDTMTKTAGVPEHLITALDSRAVTAIVWYVRANFGPDRTDTNRCYTQYKHKLRELQTEDGGIWDGGED